MFLNATSAAVSEISKKRDEWDEPLILAAKLTRPFMVTGKN